MSKDSKVKRHRKKGTCQKNAKKGTHELEPKREKS